MTANDGPAPRTLTDEPDRRLTITIRAARLYGTALDFPRDAD